MKIALVSLNQYWENKEKNFNLCLDYIQKVSERKVDLIIFPEMTLTGFSNNINHITEEEDSWTVKSFSKTAKENNIAIIFGATIKEQNKASNRAYFVDNCGNIKAIYKKIHPFSFAGEDKFYIGGNELKSVIYKDLSIGLSICYDLRFPELYSALSKNNDLIVNIANWPNKRIDHWYTLLKARAIENQLFIAGINRIGIDGNNLEYQRSSTIYNANGESIKSEEFGNMEIFNIDKNWTKEFRSKFNTTNDKKIDFYKTIL